MEETEMSYFKDMEKSPEVKHRGVSGNGYMALLAAVAEQAVDDLVLKFPKRPNCPKGSKREKAWEKRCGELRQYQAGAERYVFNEGMNDENSVFGFSSIMKMINVNPDRARAAIRERMAEAVALAIERNKTNKGVKK
jgi:hypothetical protein